MQAFNTTPLLLAGFFCLLTPLAQATPPPPWIASVDGENLEFTQNNCASSAAKVLKNQGFARITPQGDKVFAALNSGKQYGYKAVVHCLSNYNFVNVTVVAERSGGLKQAQSILSAMRRYAVAADAEIETEVLPDDESGFPDCSDGPTLMRCLNSTPIGSVGLAIEYLRQRTAETEK